MYTSGIVRRIDDLGRIVIPKEIRKKLRIRDGENLEILVENGNILLKKYSVMKNIEDFACHFTDAIYSFIKYNILITNEDSVIASSGPLKKKFLNKNISESLITCIRRKENIHEKYQKILAITEKENVEATYAMSTIINQGDPVGLVIIFSEDEVITESDMRICEIAAKILSKYLDE